MMDNSNITNCVNCGAVLTSWKCEYCGTEYKQKPKFINHNFEIQAEGIMKAIAIFNSEPELDCYFDKDGVLHRC